MHPLDEHIGRKLREARLASAFSMEVFAHKLGLSLNQYRRYERGQSAIKCQLLADISEKLGLRIEHFIDGYHQVAHKADATKSRGGGRQRAEWSQRIYDLAQTKPIGSRIRFPHGSLPSTASAKRAVVKHGGGMAWANVRYTTSALLITKVAEPRNVAS